MLGTLVMFGARHLFSLDVEGEAFSRLAPSAFRELCNIGSSSWPWTSQLDSVGETIKSPLVLHYYS